MPDRTMSATGVKIEPYERDCEAAWDRYVRNHAGGSLFHLAAWQKAVAGALGHEACYRVAWRDRQVVGVLPVFLVNGMAGRNLISVPRATYGGVLADDAEAARALLDEGRSLVETCDARSLELRSVMALDSQLPIRSRQSTYRRALPSDPDEVTAQWPRRARAVAQRACESHNLTVEFEDAHPMAACELLSRSTRRPSSAESQFRFLEALVCCLKEHAQIQIVRNCGRTVAGLLTFLYNDTVMPYFCGIDERAGIHGLSHYLYLESMRWAAARGYSRYDIGQPCTDNPATAGFMRLCGFAPEPLEYQVYVRPGHGQSYTPQRRSIARSLWRQLPPVLTRPLGNWLARSIPG
jgi:FemAB-related protein (PEP-CTERM system-associated)